MLDNKFKPKFHCQCCKIINCLKLVVKYVEILTNIKGVSANDKASYKTYNGNQFQNSNYSETQSYFDIIQFQAYLIVFHEDFRDMYNLR